MGGRTYREGERLPREVATQYRRQQQSERPVDPAGRVADAPPNFGRPVLPHVMTFRGMVTSLARAYRHGDEAYRHSVENAHMMLNDPVISGPVFARQTMVSLLNWSIEPEDEKDKELKSVAEKLTDIVQRTPRFTEYRRSLSEAIWYGRCGIQHQHKIHVNRRGERSYVVRNWTPISGDKILFRYDDGKGEYDPDQIGIKVSPTLAARDRIAGDRKLEPSGDGLAYFLQPWERSMVAIHKHLVRDAEFEDPIAGSSIHGVGLRNFLYWVWYQKQETLAELMEIIERTGMGITVYYYPAGNVTARNEVEKVAREQGHLNVLLMPYESADPDSCRIEQIPANTAGIEALLSIIEDYFGDMITRFVLGQTLSTKATATGLGSGVADLHQDSLAQIVKYDAVNLEETITRELIWPLRDLNFPKFRNVDFWFRISTEATVPEKELEAISKAWEMGAEIKTSDLMDRIGLSSPGPEDKRIFNPQIRSAIQQVEQGGMMPPGMPGGGMPPGTPPGAGGDMPGMGGDPPGGPPPTPDNPDDDNQGDGDGQIDIPDQQQKPDVANLFGPILNAKERYRKDPALRQAIADAAATTDTNPSDAAREAGNYRKGRFRLHGLHIAIENAQGTRRRPEWPTLAAHYGYIKRTESEADGDHVDVFIGDHPESELVYVVDQVKPSGRFDEHKVMLGYTSAKDAKEAYLANYTSDWKCGPVTAMTIRQFRNWLERGDTGRPISKQVSRYARGRKPSKGQAGFDWDEGKHPRDEGGKFASGEGGGSGGATMADEPFSLEVGKATDGTKKVEFGNTGGRQGMLLSGLDSLPGQMDLFADMDKADESLSDATKTFPTARESALAGKPYADWTGPISEAFVNEEIDEDHPAWQSISSPDRPSIDDYNDAKSLSNQHVSNYNTGASGKLIDFSDDLKTATIQHPDGSTSQHDRRSLDHVGAVLEHKLSKSGGPNEIPPGARRHAEYMADVIAREAVDNGLHVDEVMKSHGIRDMKARMRMRSLIGPAMDAYRESLKPPVSEGRKRAQDKRNAADNHPETVFVKGDEGVPTGETKTMHGGEFMAVKMINGKDEGKIKWVPTKVQREQESEQRKREWKDQQEGFRRLREGQQNDQYAKQPQQPGATKTVNGKTYVLNQNHRWELSGKNAGAGGESSSSQPSGSESQIDGLDALPDGTTIDGWEKFTDPQLGMIVWGKGDEAVTTEHLQGKVKPELLAEAVRRGADGPEQPQQANPEPSPTPDSGQPAKPNKPKRDDTIQMVAAMFGINAGDAKNRRRAANFVHLAARKLGHDPQGETREEQSEDAAKFLAGEKQKLDATVQMAEQFGFKGKAQSLVTRSKSAAEFLIKQAAKEGYQPTGRAHSDLVGALKHLAANSSSETGGSGTELQQIIKALGGNRQLMNLAAAVIGFWVVYSYLKSRRRS